MLYTSYIANMKNLPQGKYVLITRWKPKSLKLNKYEDAYWEPSLSPSDMLVASYKNHTLSLKDLLNSFKSYLENSLEANLAIMKLVEEIKNGKDVFLICYEKELYECHRKIVAEYISEKHNIEWKEY